MRDLPPLKALRAFEACFRFNSFTKAAESLNVGQPAISHQIRALEADLGKRLFKKRGAMIEPTAEARTYYLSIQPAMTAIADASRTLRNQGKYQGVQIGSYPGLATYWLSPILAELSRKHPSSAIRLITAEQDRDLALDGLDCAILFGAGDWKGTESELLIREEVIAVASPEMHDQWKNADAAELLQSAPLIDLQDQEERWFHWNAWKAHMRLEDAHFTPALTVFNHALAIHQALTGQGIALAWRGVVDTLIEEKKLKAFSFPALTSDRGYYLVSKPGFMDSPSGRLLLRYLRD